jgi:TRAP-type mannitol/chloroaromatic compound transport system permease small subunit
MRRYRSLIDLVNALSDWTGKLVSALIFLMIGVTIWVVVLRYVFNLAFFWNPVATYENMLSVYIILGAAYALRTRAYVNIDILHRRFSPRTRAVIDMATSAFFFFVFIILLWQVLKAAGGELLTLDFSLRLLLSHNWPVMLVWPAGILLLLLQGLVKFAQDLITAVTGEEAP